MGCMGEHIHTLNLGDPIPPLDEDRQILSQGGGFTRDIDEPGRVEVYNFMDGLWTVSYTHLDVYKRQVYDTL